MLRHISFHHRNGCHGKLNKSVRNAYNCKRQLCYNWLLDIALQKNIRKLKQTFSYHKTSLNSYF